MAPKYVAASLSALAAYFAYHAFAGQQGLGHWSDMQARLTDKQAELATLQKANDALRADIARLTPGTVDADLVELLARENLGFVYPDEIVLMIDADAPAF
ncbi:septum formation initiator family protein [Henriciella sp. AS95]|uniref:FtsB family cell division protein n=1 Tax=Henriciella sp. AS95 TaxID=3135782 RepID=UPI0031714791